MLEDVPALEKELVPWVKYLDLRDRRMRTDVRLRFCVISMGISIIYLVEIGANSIPILFLLMLAGIVSVLGYVAWFLVVVTKYMHARRCLGIKVGGWGDEPRDSTTAAHVASSLNRAASYRAKRVSIGLEPSGRASGDRYPLWQFFGHISTAAISAMLAGSIALIVAHGNVVKLTVGLLLLAGGGLALYKCARSAVIVGGADVVLRSPLRTRAIGRAHVGQFVLRDPRLAVNLGLGNEDAWVQSVHVVLRCEVTNGESLSTHAVAPSDLRTRRGRSLAQLMVDVNERLRDPV